MIRQQVELLKFRLCSGVCNSANSQLPTTNCIQKDKVIRQKMPQINFRAQNMPELGNTIHSSTTGQQRTITSDQDAKTLSDDYGQGLHVVCCYQSKCIPFPRPVSVWRSLQRTSKHLVNTNHSSLFYHNNDINRSPGGGTMQGREANESTSLSKVGIVETDQIQVQSDNFTNANRVVQYHYMDLGSTQRVGDSGTLNVIYSLCSRNIGGVLVFADEMYACIFFMRRQVRLQMNSFLWLLLLSSDR